MEISLIIADHHQLFRESLANLFKGNSFEVSALAANGMEALQLARELKPDIIIMDIGNNQMGGMDGIKATEMIRKELPEIKIIGLSMHKDKKHIHDMLQAGAHGYLTKNCCYNELTEALKTVFKGNKYLCRDITNTVIDDLLLNDNAASLFEKELTEREKEVFKLYANGHTTRQIADKLFVSIKTVGTHKTNILKKLNLKSAGDMIKFAYDNELFAPC